MRNIDKYKDDLCSLVKLGQKMELDLTFRYLRDQGQHKEEDQKSAKKINGCFESDYQRWYTESCAVIKQLIPDRITEFEHLYKGDGRRKEINSHTYTIQDWHNGVRSGTGNWGRTPISYQVSPWCFNK